MPRSRTYNRRNDPAVQPIIGVAGSQLLIGRQRRAGAANEKAGAWSRSGSVGVGPHEDAGPIWGEHGNPGLVGVAPDPHIQPKRMGSCVERVAGPVIDALNQLAQALYLLVPHRAMPHSAACELPLQR